jgi:hypothetical protein
VKASKDKASLKSSSRGATVTRKLSQREIVDRLQMVAALTAEGLPIAEAIRSAGLLRVDYDRWRIEYDGLIRTLGPLARATQKLAKRARPASRGRPIKAPN